MRGFIKDVRMAVRFFQNVRRIRKEHEARKADVCRIDAYRRRKGAGV